MADAFAIAIERAWYRPPRFLLLLLPLEWLFIGLTALRRLAYRRGWLRAERIACPVVIVGNITVGGTGKTPLVIALVKALRALGVSVGVISRGYGGNYTEIQPVTASSSASEVGDEALLIARSTGAPVYVGRDRASAANALVRDEAPQLIVSDDGLQHYRLHRDVEVVTTDATRGYGNGHRLPVGPLREGLHRLENVDFRLTRGSDDPRHGVRFEPRCFRSLDGAKVRDVNNHGLGPRVHAVAAIANPDRFFTTLRSLGLDPQERVFPDHHAFEADDFADLIDLPLLMTAKDAVKCEALQREDVWVLEIDACLPEGFAQDVLAAARIAVGGNL